MRSTLPITSLLAATLLAGACGSSTKPKQAPTLATAPGATNPVPDQQQTPEATAELQRALLALSRVHFAYDSAALSDEGREALTEASVALIKYTNVELAVEGHGDERGTAEYNIALGERRAQSVADFLVRLGVAPERLHVVSYGEEKPLRSGHTTDDYAHNRRVDFQLTRGDIEIILNDSPVVDDESPPITKAHRTN